MVHWKLECFILSLETYSDIISVTSYAHMHTLAYRDTHTHTHAYTKIYTAKFERRIPFSYTILIE